MIRNFFNPTRVDHPKPLKDGSNPTRVGLPKPLKEGPKEASGFFPVIVLSLFCLLLYSNTLSSPFIFDGVNLIEDNISIRNPNDLGAIFKFWPSRFITFLSFSLNYHIHQLDVFGYHIVNLAIHLGATILVWWFIQLLFLTPRLKDTEIAKEARLIAFLASLIFTSHPVQTQAVTYIYQRSTILASLFYLLSLCLYLRVRLTHRNTLVSAVLYIASIISALLGMFTKEIVFTLPFLILLLELYFLRKNGKSSLKYAIPFLLLLAVIPLTLIFTKTVYFKAQGILADKNIMPHLSSKYYLLTQFRVIITYIRLLFLPINQTIDYDYPISRSLFEIPTLISLVSLLVILITAFRLYSRYPLLSFSILWFFLTLVPESSIITLNDVINEHRLYLPTAGFSLFLAGSLYHLFKGRPKLLLCLIVIFLTFYSTLAYFRNIVWKDDLTLWSDTVDKSPNKARGYYARGVSYSKRGEYDKAISDFTAALNIEHNYPDAYFNRANAYSKMGQYDKAISDYTRVLNITPNDKEAYNNRAIAYASIGKYIQAIEDFNRALIIVSDNPDVYINRANAYAKIKEYNKAILDLTTALRFEPKYARAYYEMGLIFFMKKDFEKSREYVRKAQELGYKVDSEFTKSLFRVDRNK